MFRHKSSGKTFSEDEMEKKKKSDDHKDGDYEEVKDKSDLTEDDLRKSLAEIEAFHSNGSPELRQKSLMKKALDTTLSDGEKVELMELMGGGAAKQEPSLGDTVKGLLTTPSKPGEVDLVKSQVEVSPFLREFSERMIKSQVAIADFVQTDSRRQHEFNLVLAKAIAANGNLALEMKSVLEEVLEQPVGQPTAVGIKPGTRPIQKAFGNDGETGPQPAEIKKALNEMHWELLSKNDPSSKEIHEEIVRYESTGMLSKSVQDRITRRLSA